MADTRELQLTERAYIITLLRILLFAVGGSVGAFCWYHTLRKSQIRVRSTTLDSVRKISECTQLLCFIFVANVENSKIMSDCDLMKHILIKG